MKEQLESRLITLPSGQHVGSPITRRELKRQLREKRLKRRGVYRQLRRNGLSYKAAREMVASFRLSQ